jgi:uncharacterized protein YjbK
MERELKLALDAGEYLRLASSLAGYAGEVALANHYFDSGSQSLGSRGAMLRVRETADGYVAGLKQAVSVHGGAFEAAEWELEIPSWDWQRVLRAGGDLGILEHPVIREGFALARSAVLPYQGSLRVLRKTFRLSAATRLELDLCLFEDGSQDWEIEVETESPADLRPILKELLDRRGVVWREQTRTKYERFLDRRGSAPAAPLVAREGEVQTVGDGALVLRTPLAGAAVFASRRFVPGDPILELDGTAAGPGPRPPGRRWIQIGRRRFMDVTGTMTHHVRHSCQPAAGLRETRRLVARRTIEPGEEITYDWAMTEMEVEAVCLCRTPACRGLVAGWRRLPGRLRRAYRGWTADYLLEENGAAQRASVPAADLERGYRYGARAEGEASASQTPAGESPAPAE